MSQADFRFVIFAHPTSFHSGVACLLGMSRSPETNHASEKWPKRFVPTIWHSLQIGKVEASSQVGAQVDLATRMGFEKRRPPPSQQTWGLLVPEYLASGMIAARKTAWFAEKT